MFLSAPLFGSKHISGFIVVSVILIAALHFTVSSVKNKSESKKYIVLQVATILLIASEIFKLSYVYITRGSISPHLYPFQLCSFTLFASPLAAFGSKKIRNYVLPFAFSINMIAGFLPLLLPTTILGGSLNWFPLSENVMPIHSFFYHGLMIFIGIYIVSTNLLKPKYVDILRAMSLLLLATLYAGIGAIIFDKDYMFLKYGKGNPLQFILTMHGHFIYLLVMVITAFVLVSITFIIAIEVQNVKDKLTNTAEN